MAVDLYSDRLGAACNIDGSEIASITGIVTVYSDWVPINNTQVSTVFELLWSGDLQGTIGLDVAGRGPANEIPYSFLRGITNPDGTSYAGDLEATVLENEAIGSEIIDMVEMGPSRIRLKYANASGTGEMRLFVHTRKYA